MGLKGVRLDGKTAVITGANTGIGKIAARDFFERGARVIIACRNEQKAEEAIQDIKKQCASGKNLGELAAVRLDLSSLTSVRKCAQHLLQTEQRIDLLINNAGIMMCPFSKTEDGFELQIGTNHLGHFLFTLLLLPKIIGSAPARIVIVSSVASTMVPRMDLDDLNWEKKPYHERKAYYYSKLANVLFSNELSRRLKEHNITGVTTYSLHPGVIYTDLYRHVDNSFLPCCQPIFRCGAGLFMKTPEQGAQTTIHCAVNEKCANETGLYYADSKVHRQPPGTKKEGDAKKLWDMSWKLVGLDENYNPFATNKT